MKDKLVLVDVREGETRRRSTQIIIYSEAHDILKDLNARTGQSFSMLANRLIKFAYNYVVIDSDSDEEDKRP